MYQGTAWWSGVLMISSQVPAKPRALRDLRAATSAVKQWCLQQQPFCSPPEQFALVGDGHQVWIPHNPVGNCEFCCGNATRVHLVWVLLSGSKPSWAAAAMPADNLEPSHEGAGAGTVSTKGIMSKHADAANLTFALANS